MASGGEGRIPCSGTQQAGERGGWQRVCQTRCELELSSINHYPAITLRSLLLSPSRNQDVHYFLPKGTASQWSIAEQSRVVLLAWFLIHELSHAVGSVLAYQKKIVAPGTPKKATAFAENGNINVKYVAWDEEGNITGERGWWMEDKLGGKVSLYVSCLFDRRYIIEDLIPATGEGKSTYHSETR